jgi:integrase
MALYKRPGSNYWWIELKFEWKRHRLSTKLKNKRQAETFEAAYRTQLANDRVDLKPRALRVATFSEAVADFLKWSKIQQVESTYRRYLTSSKATASFFGEKKVTHIDRQDVERFVEWRVKQKRKAPARQLKKNPRATGKKQIRPATVNRELAFLRVVFSRLVDKDVITRNPVSKFKFLPEDNEQLRVLDRSEDPVYLIACSQPLRDVAELMLETGMRPAEVLGLEKRHVNFEQGYVQVEKGKTKSARRRIPLSGRARSVLERRYSKASGSFLLFAGGRDGKGESPIIKLNNAHDAAVARSGLARFRLYDCRHTFATRAVEAGIDLITLKDLLGHSRLDMVLRYAHPTEKHRFEAIRKLEEYRQAK